MGIPRFFRWISERYPLSSSLITENNVPDFDNLYLDMNGIIHTASHPPSADGSRSYARPEALVFREIFAYVELLFSKIRPRKVFFLAVDGVAPRAKLNQQRARRFRTALEAAAAADAPGDTDSPSTPGALFDSNCITPGTRFMFSLQQHLEYFVAAKMKDPQWRAVRVILSGPATPGEGEHKIMEFIRHHRAQPDYDPNTRHCLYGLDADLIMLGLLSHAPHFALLREEVKFGSSSGSGRAKRKSRIERVNEGKRDRLESTRFYLMHLGLVRDYLEEEFIRIPNRPNQSVERIIDDIILMSILVGNDFLPHLPHLHVSENALGLLFDAYKAVFGKLDGYLNEGGRVQFKRLSVLLQQLSLFEVEKMEEEWGSRLPQIRGTLPANSISASMRSVYEQVRDALLVGSRRSVELALENVSLRAFTARMAADFNLSLSVDPSKQTTILSRASLYADDSDGAETADGESSEAITRVVSRYERMKVVPDSSLPSLQAQEDGEAALLSEWKTAYYDAKMGLAERSEHEQLAREYAVGMQWVIYYYYEGVASWSWFYPYHYSPHISDLAAVMSSLDSDAVQFDLGEPLKPLEQLMAVLPSASASLLPAVLSGLMASELADLYPTSFKQDLNGKKNSWEAVVLIPFIDEKRLLTAMRSRYLLLDSGEQALNVFGPARSFEFVENMACRLDTPSAGNLPVILDCPSRITDFHLPPIPAHMQAGFWTGTLQGVDRLAPGFPSLLSGINHHPCLDPVGVVLFGNQTSPHPSLLLCVAAPECKEWIPPDTPVLVDWPYLREAVVVEPFNDNERISESIKRRLLTGKAIRVPGDDTLIGVRCVLGRSFDTATGTVAKRFEEELSWFPRSMVIANRQKVQEHLDAIDGALNLSLATLYPVNSKCVFLGKEWFGCVARIVEIVGTRGSANLLQVQLEPDSSSHLPIYLASMVKKRQNDAHFMPIHEFAKQIKLPTLLVSKLLSSFVVFDDLDSVVSPAGNTSLPPHRKPACNDMQRHDIGLRMKYEARGLMQEDSCRRNQQGYLEVSKSARQLLASYKSRFPVLFGKLLEFYKEERVVLSRVFAKSGAIVTPADKQLIRAEMASVKNWLREQGVGDKPLVGEGSTSASSDVCSFVERYVNNLNASDRRRHSLISLCVPTKLIMSVETAAEQLAELSKSSKLDHHIGDRVRYIGRLYSFGALGTIVGVLLDDNRGPGSLEIVLDNVLAGMAGDLGGRCSAGRGVVVDADDVLNLRSASALAVNDDYRANRLPVSSLFPSKPRGKGHKDSSSAKRQPSSKPSITELLRRAAISDSPPHEPPHRDQGPTKS